MSYVSTRLECAQQKVNVSSGS